MRWQRRLSAAGVMAAGAMAAMFALGPSAGADGSPVTVNVGQNATGINVCAAGATCTQKVDVLNVSVVIVVTGAVPAPAHVSLLPANLYFGDAIIGHAGPVRSVALANTGGLPAVIVGLQISGGDPAFAVQPGSCGTDHGAVILPGRRCNLRVSFAPTTLGPKRARLLVNIDNAATLTSGLTGSGVRTLPLPVRHAAVVTPPPPTPNPSLPLPVNLAAATPVMSGSPPTPAGWLVNRTRLPRIQFVAPMGSARDELAKLVTPASPARSTAGAHSATAAPTTSTLGPSGLALWAVIPALAAALTFAGTRLLARARRRPRFGLVSQT